MKSFKEFMNEASKKLVLKHMTDDGVITDEEDNYLVYVPTSAKIENYLDDKSSIPNICWDPSKQYCFGVSNKDYEKVKNYADDVLTSDEDSTIFNIRDNNTEKLEKVLKLLNIDLSVADLEKLKDSNLTEGLLSMFQAIGRGLGNTVANVKDAYKSIEQEKQLKKLLKTLIDMMKKFGKVRFKDSANYITELDGAFEGLADKKLQPVLIKVLQEDKDLAQQFRIEANSFFIFMNFLAKFTSPSKVQKYQELIKLIK